MCRSLCGHRLLFLLGEYLGLELLGHRIDASYVERGQLFSRVAEPSGQGLCGWIVPHSGQFCVSPVELLESRGLPVPQASCSVSERGRGQALRLVQLGGPPTHSIFAPFC